MKQWATCVLVTLLLGVRASHNLYKVTLTQKGYIQFLKYEVSMPVLQDFTFCIWIRSTNLSYPHPIFSYSRNETERLARSWISPPGTLGSLARINLEVLRRETPGVEVNIVLGRWYHICQSWASYTGHWTTYINGNLAAAGQSSQLRGLAIPEGEVVVGQEYTDFDRGLDDGVEGEVFGFNLMSSSALPWTRIAMPERALISNGYSHCAAGRGSPLPRKMLLVSWAWSPVRVYGGAVIQPARPLCGLF